MTSQSAGLIVLQATRVQSFRSIPTHHVETLTDISRRIFPLHCRMFSALLAGCDVRATQTDINCMVDGYIFHDAILRGDFFFFFILNRFQIFPLNLFRCNAVVSVLIPK